jgi:N utilization substance protein B
MPARHRSRQRALQVLFLWDQRRQAIDEAIHSFYDTLSSDEDDPPQSGPDEFMERLVRGASEHASAIDRRISDKSEHWRLERMPAVDRNILRLAVYEMSELKTPVPVVIDEALELARQFSGDESVSFINGVLDAVHKEADRVPDPPTPTDPS